MNTEKQNHERTNREARAKESRCHIFQESRNLQNNFDNVVKRIVLNRNSKSALNVLYIFVQLENFIRNNLEKKLQKPT